MKTAVALVAAAAAAAAAAAVVAASALANDLWLAPSAFRPKVGDEVAIRLMTGEKLAGTSRKRDDARIDTFAVWGPDGQQADAAGKTGDDPAGTVRPTDDGVWVVGFRSKPASVGIEAAKFEEYLRAEGLERIVDERARLGETDAKGREVYVRCAKAILAVGADKAVRLSPGADRSLGFPCEIAPETNPYTAAAGDTIAFRLTFRGKPVEGVLVRARSAAKPDTPVERRTDAEGRVKLVLPEAGTWFVGGVHMIRSDPEKTFAEWESLWASVTFALPEKAAAAPPPAPAVPPK